VNPISFTDLHDRMTEAGIAVGIAHGPRGHAITLDDPDSLRSVRFPVSGARFDRAATALVVSARLQDLLGGCDWPELTR
jgi:hypothetical protein